MFLCLIKYFDDKVELCLSWPKVSVCLWTPTWSTCIWWRLRERSLNILQMETPGSVITIIANINTNFSTYQVGEGTTIAAYTAHNKTATKVSLPTSDSKYPHGVAGQKVSVILIVIISVILVSGSRGEGSLSSDLLPR